MNVKLRVGVVGWEHLTTLDGGDLDFPAFLRIVHQAGFDGYVSIEHGTHLGRDDICQMASAQAPSSHLT